MHKIMKILATVLWATSLPAHAANHIVNIAFGADGRSAHSTGVEPGKFVEVCGKLIPGDAIRWEFDASAPLDFNIHYHRGKATEFPAKRTQVSSGQDILRAAANEDYCWMWSNKSASQVRIDLRLKR